MCLGHQSRTQNLTLPLWMLCCRYTPYGMSKCLVCKQSVYKPDHQYCHTCAYQKGG